MSRVLITGGAGFIGSHVADALVARGDEVVVLDNLTAQVHGGSGRPEYLHDEVKLVVGDIRDRAAVSRALHNVDRVLHLAAAVGVGQSMYDMALYTETNDVGTAILLEALARKPVARLVVASSMSVYGEGLYRRPDGDVVMPDERSAQQLRRGLWELQDGEHTLQPIATPEIKKPSLSSIYAMNKFAQERMCLIAGKAYDIPTVALRFFNVYGPRQALSNPYTGVLAIFAARLMNGRAPLVFEDGRQRRDFVHVQDVARACVLALDSDCSGQVLNIGSGEGRTILSVAVDLAAAMGRSDLVPNLTGKYRAGDIRHCFADIQRSQAALGFVPNVDFRSGIRQLTEYLADQVAEDRVESATDELLRRGLVA